MRAVRPPIVPASDATRLPEPREAFDRAAHLAAREGRAAAALLVERSETGVRVLGRSGLDAPMEELALDIAKTDDREKLSLGLKAMRLLGRRVAPPAERTGRRRAAS